MTNFYTFHTKKQLLNIYTHVAVTLIYYTLLTKLNFTSGFFFFFFFFFFFGTYSSDVSAVLSKIGPLGAEVCWIGTLLIK